LTKTQTGPKDTSTTSSSNPAEDLPDIEMSFPENTTQEEPHTEVNSPVMQTEHIEETEEQLLTDQVRKTLTFHKNRNQAKATAESEG
jgi:hypothetical protein